MNPASFLVTLIAQHPDAVAGLLSFVVLGLINGLLPTKVNGNIVTRVVSVLVDRLSPLTRKDARATLKWPLFSASVLRDVADAIDPPRPSSNGQRGAVRVGALLVIAGVMLLAIAAGALLSGCPNWNRPACPRAGVYSCVSDQPHVCSPTGELTPIGDEACGLQGRVCSVDDAGVAFCARAADGGVR